MDGAVLKRIILFFSNLRGWAGPGSGPDPDLLA
jgi:hypothetical protein